MVISAIITSYNKGPYIKDCLLGVLNQDFKGDIEVILADDCSTDNTNQEISSLREHPNFKYVKYTRHEKNKGLMGNFLWALNQAKGKYIALCDGDDVWTSMNKLTRQIEVLESNETLIAVGTRENIMDTRINGYRTKYGDYLIDYSSSQIIKKEDFFQYSRLPFHTSTLLFRNESGIILALNNFSWVHITNDVALYHVLNAVGDIYFLNETLVTQSRNDLGVTNNFNENDLKIIANNFFLYNGCAKLYDNQEYRKLLLDKSLFYKKKIIQKCKNRKISDFYVTLHHFGKHKQFKVLLLYFQIFYAKAKGRF